MERAQAGRTRRPVRGAAAVIVAVLAGIVFSGAANAAPGDLDFTFSGNGKQTTDFRFGLSSAAATVVQPDGKIVAVGVDRAADSGGDFAVARYNPNGTLDRTFSGDGRRTTDFDYGDDGAHAVALQADGKIVVVGTSNPHRPDFALARYNPNGSLDRSFSGDGRQTTDFGGPSADDGATGIAIQADGEIVVVGHADASHFNGITDFALARYKPDGSLDTSFSGDGKKTTDFGAGIGANGVALQANGKIVAVGGSGGDFALARYNVHGVLDTSFSGDGRLTTDFGGDDAASGVVLQGNKIIAVGRGGSTRHFALARYKPDGSLDTSFSGDGKKTTGFGGDAFANQAALQENGKIVAVGFAEGGAGRDFALARYNPNGTLDTSFSGDGRQTTDFGGDDGASGVAIQADGEIVAVGAGRGPNQFSDFALARYDPDGSLDTSFSGDGRQTTDFGGVDWASGVALQTDGKIVVVGRAIGRLGGASDFALARYNPNGSLDTSFSGDGRQTTDFGGDAEANGVALQPNGKIVVVGRSGGDFALARYTVNGALDTSFAGDGKQTTAFGGSAEATGVALQGDGKIVVAGRGGFPSDFALARYKPDGSLDTSFSGDGRQTTDFGGSDGASGVALQANGAIVAAGGVGGDFALARYTPTGVLDTSFSGDGRQTTDFGGLDGAGGVAIQANGKIVAVGGGLASGSGSDFALARYSVHGALDRSFSGDGKQTTDFGGYGQATGVALQPNGRIVAVGSGGFPGHFALSRYTTNGTLDASFSGDGKQTTDFGSSAGSTAVAAQPDGGIVAVGSGRGPNQAPDFAVARYLGG